MHVHTIGKKYIGVGDIYPDGQNFQIFCQFEKKKNGNKSAILNFIWTKLHRIYKRIIFKACVAYLEEICIGVGDIYLDGQIF